MHTGTSFPVGKVEFLKLYPLTYEEYLLATGKELFVDILQKKDTSMMQIFKQTYIETLKQYYFIGGMPEAVSSFSTQHDLNEVRAIQSRILEAYQQDFSKHTPNEIVPKIRMVWNSVPWQLAKENKKFIYGLIREGGRAKDYETAIMWLSDCGLIHRCNRVTAPHLPLKAYEDLKAFKLFLLDIGLLGCMCGLSQQTLLNGNEVFIEYKSALSEQYVLQQLITRQEYQLYYYTNDRGSCEIDFLLDDGKKIKPLEVMAEVNLKAKCLRSFYDKYQPQTSIRTSMADYEIQDWLVNIPLYAVQEITELCKSKESETYQ